ncbi:hypothetical protein PDN15_13805 [Bacillus cereus]|uniref:hypothetical protein n=1 Tax=Bacillus cereus group sp. Bce019 TaxID=3445247 RepID=UPI003F27E3BF|nr:hypothetical protein [Bacillus cereus]MDA2345298.1 hypothetical protein [Bacillus cereus]MDA2350651.1 hypothetical protein [Bacillus cereus]
MRAKKLVTLAVPFMLLVGCEVGDKDSTHKTEQTSKAITILSEQQYPYYICEQVVEFQFKKDELLLNLGESLKDKEKAKAKAVLKTSNEIDKILDNMEHIKVPDTYKDIHKSIQEGVTEARKATKLIKDAGKEDKQKIQEAAMKGTEFLSGVDGEHWKKAVYELSQENKDAYSKALDKKVKEHSK